MGALACTATAHIYYLSIDTHAGEHVYGGAMIPLDKKSFRQ